MFFRQFTYMKELHSEKFVSYTKFYIPIRHHERFACSFTLEEALKVHSVVNSESLHLRGETST